MAVDTLVLPENLKITAENSRGLDGGAWEDYKAGDRFDHRDGMTIEEAEHMLAARLWQNTA